MTIDYEKLVGCCSACDRKGFNIVENGYCHVDLNDNGICLECYNELIKNNLAKKFRVEWLDNPRKPNVDIYE